MNAAFLFRASVFLSICTVTTGIGWMPASAGAAPPQTAVKTAAAPNPRQGGGPTPFFVPRAPRTKDPFRPFMDIDPAVIQRKAENLKKKKIDASKSISPLQTSPVESFRLVGIAVDSRRRTAVLEDKASKRHYPVFTGTLIGPNEGKIVRISEDRLIIEEAAAQGGASRNRIEMLLHDDR